MLGNPGSQHSCLLNILADPLMTLTVVPQQDSGYSHITKTLAIMTHGCHHAVLLAWRGLHMKQCLGGFSGKNSHWNTVL